MTNNPQHTSLQPYLVIFTIALFVISIILVLMNMVLGQSGTNGIKFVSPFMASLFVGERFLKTEHRLPTKAERRVLVLSSLAIYVLIEGFFIFAAYVTGALQAVSEAAANTSMMVTVIFGVFVVTCLINWALMNWGYNGILKKRAGRLGINLGNTFD